MRERHSDANKIPIQRPRNPTFVAKPKKAKVKTGPRRKATVSAASTATMDDLVVNEGVNEMRHEHHGPNPNQPLAHPPAPYQQFIWDMVHQQGSRWNNTDMQHQYLNS